MPNVKVVVGWAECNEAQPKRSLECWVSLPLNPTYELIELDRQVTTYGDKIQAVHHTSEVSQRLSDVPGIGPITATALLAALGDGKAFTSARQVAAWLGLVPRQDSSGGKPRLLGISKRGDVYLRTLLIHGGRAVVNAAAKKDDA